MSFKPLLLSFLITLSNSLLAQVKGEAEVLKALCNYENASLARYFNPYFLSKLPVKKLEVILDTFKKEEGACVSVEKIDKNNFLYTTDRSQRAMQLYLDKNQKVRGLWFGNATAFSDKLTVMLEELKTFEGKTALSLIKNGKTEILSYNSNLPLAVDSSSSLLILKLLADKVRKTKLNWTSSVKIKNANKGIPGGKLYNWPEKSPVTIQTLATMLMAYSDDTANDHLHKIVGRKSLERKSKRNKPFLTTREYNKLKSSLSKGYGTKKIAEKRALVSKIDKTPWKNLEIVDTPFELNSIGWMFTTKELCGLLYGLRKLPFSTVNSGLLQKTANDFASFKMGRAPGVLQYTQLFKSSGSKDYHCLSVTWNKPTGTIEPSKVDALMGRILSKIK